MTDKNPYHEVGQMEDKELILLGLIVNKIQELKLDEYEIARIVEYLADRYCEYTPASMRCSLDSIRHFLDKANQVALDIKKGRI